MQFGDAYTTDKGMKVLYSGLAGLVAGALGVAGYYFTNKRSVSIRVIVLLVLIIGLALPTILMPQSAQVMSKDGIAYSTCPVCGYIAFNTQEKSCDNCGEELTEEEIRKNGLTSLDSLIRMDQLYYFIPDDEHAAVSFEQPTVSEDGYPLDKTWQPSVTKAEVEKQAVQYYEYSRTHPVKVEIIKKQQN